MKIFHITNRLSMVMEVDEHFSLNTKGESDKKQRTSAKVGTFNESVSASTAWYARR